MPIAFGTDAQHLRPPYDKANFELVLMVEAGAHPLEAFTSATVGAADLMDLSGQPGTLEAGKTQPSSAGREGPFEDIRSVTGAREIIWTAEKYSDIIGIQDLGKERRGMENLIYQPTRVHFGAGRLNEVGAVVGSTAKVHAGHHHQRGGGSPALYDRVKGLLAGAASRWSTLTGGAQSHHRGHRGGHRHRPRREHPGGAGGGGRQLHRHRQVHLPLPRGGQGDWGEVFSSYTDPFAEYESPSR